MRGEDVPLESDGEGDRKAREGHQDVQQGLIVVLVTLRKHSDERDSDAPRQLQRSPPIPVAAEEQGSLHGNTESKGRNQDSALVQPHTLGSTASTGFARTLTAAWIPDQHSERRHAPLS